MVAKKKLGAKNFWSKMLSAHKVKRILQKRGFDTEAFRRDYETDSNRGPRKASRPPDRQISSAEAVLKSGDYPGLLSSLGTKSRPKADAAIRRVVTWNGQASAKAVSRRART